MRSILNREGGSPRRTEMCGGKAGVKDADLSEKGANSDGTVGLAISVTGATKR
jgi:hypothetical protein